MTRLRTISFILTLSLVLTGSANAETKSFMTMPGDMKNVVKFTSEATLEEIVGTTSAITGSLDLNLADLTATTKGSFDVDLNKLDTGIGMRNEHMRSETYLNTAMYPKASFVLSKIVSSDKASLSPGETANVTAEGDFTVHGVTKKYTIPAKLTYQNTSAEAEQRLYGSKGDILVVNADFSVKLTDHDIKVPQFLFMRLAEEQKISVNFAMSDQLPPKE